MDLTFEQRMSFFQELIRCAHGLYSWIFNDRFEETFSNCPDASVFRMVFSLSHTADVLLNSEYDRRYPLIFTNSIGLIWVADCVQDTQQEAAFCLIGPALFDDVSHQAIFSALQRQKLSPSLHETFIAVLEKLPVIPVTRMFEYALMLHYALTGVQITNSELQFQSQTPQKKQERQEMQRPDRHGTWAAEQALLKLVEDGNLDYQKTRGLFTSVGNVGKLSEGNPIRQVKNQIIVYTALCTRAAVRGGLPPETAYSLSDQYIQMTEACSTVPELAEISRMMQDDFIRRVHRAKSARGVSKRVQICQDYVWLHLTEKITVKALAEQVGYSQTYLSRKFKQETGKSIMDYINECRIERAKDLLVSCKMSIQEISEELGFGTQSYFGLQFKKTVGCSAGEYRNQHGKKEQ